MTDAEKDKVQKVLWRTFALADLLRILHEAEEIEKTDGSDWIWDFYRRRVLEAHHVDDIDQIDLSNAPSFKSQVSAFVAWIDARSVTPVETKPTGSLPKKSP